jgi:hypothetical protein
MPIDMLRASGVHHTYEIVIPSGAAQLRSRGTCGSSL